MSTPKIERIREVRMPISLICDQSPVIIKPNNEIDIVPQSSPEVSNEELFAEIQYLTGYSDNYRLESTNMLRTYGMVEPDIWESTGGFILMKDRLDIIADWVFDNFHDDPYDFVDYIPHYIQNVLGDEVVKNLREKNGKDDLEGMREVLDDNSYEIKESLLKNLTPAELCEMVGREIKSIGKNTYLIGYN